jgi:hypothetical protein
MSRRQQRHLLNRLPIRRRHDSILAVITRILRLTIAVFNQTYSRAIEMTAGGRVSWNKTASTGIYRIRRKTAGYNARQRPSLSIVGNKKFR